MVEVREAPLSSPRKVDKDADGEDRTGDHVMETVLMGSAGSHPKQKQREDALFQGQGRPQRKAHAIRSCMDDMRARIHEVCREAPVKGSMCL